MGQAERGLPGRMPDRGDEEGGVVVVKAGDGVAVINGVPSSRRGSRPWRARTVRARARRLSGLAC